MGIKEDITKQLALGVNDAVGKMIMKRAIDIIDSGKYYRWLSWKRDALSYLETKKNLEAVMSSEPQSKP